jgi:O-methyltransferase
MEISTYNIIQLILVLVLLIFGIYYVISEFFGRSYEPAIWKHKLSKGLIDSKLFKASKKYKDKNRFFNFWFQTQRLDERRVEGAYAELGVYKGESAEILHLMSPERDIHLFDTFEGFAEKDLKDETGKAATYTTHNFADTSIEQVKNSLKSDKFHFYQGYFPTTTVGIEKRKYALVSIDADLYKPTIAGLEYFYPLMSKGGIILIHDHNPDWPGIMQAVKEFSSNIQDVFIQLTDKDSTIMMVKD